MKKFPYNDPKLKNRRTVLRNNATQAEQLLWQRLKQKRIGGKFIRQYSVGIYILDFYCPSKRIAIEVDGAQHAEERNKKYDHERTLFLNDLDIHVLRFWNNEVCNNLDNVCDEIFHHIDPSPS